MQKARPDICIIQLYIIGNSQENATVATPSAPQSNPPQARGKKIVQQGTYAKRLQVRQLDTNRWAMPIGHRCEICDKSPMTSSFFSYLPRSSSNSNSKTVFRRFCFRLPRPPAQPRRRSTMAPLRPSPPTKNRLPFKLLTNPQIKTGLRKA